MALIMKRAFSLAFLFFLIGCASPPPLSSGDVSRSCFDGTEERIREEIVFYVNQERSRMGLAPVACDPVISAVAQGHAEDMERRDYFSHTSPEGIDVFGRLASAGVANPRASENIAYGCNSARSVVALWMGSPKHREHILGDFTKVGVGAYDLYYVLVFVK